MTSEQLENLKRIARAATIGEWHSSPGNSGSRDRKYRGASLWAGDDEAGGCIAISHVFHFGHDANWAHIAAASPKTVLALIDEIERLRAHRGTARRAIGLPVEPCTVHDMKRALGLPPSVSIVGLPAGTMRAEPAEDGVTLHFKPDDAHAVASEVRASIKERGADAARIAAVARALLSIIDRKGFMTPEHQQIIRDAEDVLR